MSKGEKIGFAMLLAIIIGIFGDNSGYSSWCLFLFFVVLCSFMTLAIDALVSNKRNKKGGNG